MDQYAIGDTALLFLVRWTAPATGIAMPKPITSGLKAKGRYGKQDFRYVAGEDVYICPAGERLAFHCTNMEIGLTLHRYWTNACQACAIRDQCTMAKERRITRWQHEHLLEDIQARLDAHPEKMRQRRQTVEHPFGTIKMWMGSTHFLMKRLKMCAPRWRCMCSPTISNGS